jgi:cell division topological specificity factor
MDKERRIELKSLDELSTDELERLLLFSAQRVGAAKIVEPQSKRSIVVEVAPSISLREPPMRLFRFLRPISSAPVARERLQVLLEYERRLVSQTDLTAALREEILAVVSRHVTIDPDQVQIKVDRGAKASILAVDIEIPNTSLATASVRCSAASDIVAAPGIVRNGAAGEPKPSGRSRTAAAVALLRDALAQGPVDAKIIERRAVEAGLLENTPIGKSKIFRSARALLGVKSHQKPGRRAAGWVWSLPDQAISDSQRAVHLGAR